MKYFVTISILAGSVTSSAAQYIMEPAKGGTPTYGTESNSNSHYVQPYTTQSRVNRSGHHQTNPNTTQLDNSGKRGNDNPYSGSNGSRSPRN